VMRFMKLLMGMSKRSKNIVVMMPARGGSKRLKNKNILPINKKPMFVYTMLQAIFNWDKKELA